MIIRKRLNTKENLGYWLYRILIFIFYTIFIIFSMIYIFSLKPCLILATERKPLIYPIKGQILVHFKEEYSDPNTGETHRHCGIDIVGNKGDKVVSSAPGKVFYVGWTPTGGKTIAIVHLLNVKTTYLNLQNYHVSVGEEVKRGQVIGTIGAEEDPSNEEVHLHFGVIVNEHYVNPEKILKMDFNDLTKFISLTYTELDEGKNVEINSRNIYGKESNDIFRSNFYDEKNDDVFKSDIYNRKTIDIFEPKIYDEETKNILELNVSNNKTLNIFKSNKNLNYRFSGFLNYIFKIFYWDDDFDNIYDWNDLDDDNNNVLDINENRDYWKWNNFIDFNDDNDGIVDWNDPDDNNNKIDDKYENSNSIDLAIYTDFGKDEIEKSLKSIIHNRTYTNKDVDYKIVVGGYCGETYDVLKSDFMNFLEDKGYNWSKMAYFSWNGPGTYHNGYDSQGSYIYFRNSMIEYLNKIPDNKKVDLIGYSQGGRLLMEFITDINNREYMKKIDQVITINSPIKGTDSSLALILKKLPWIGKFIGFLLPDKSCIPFAEVNPDLPASFNLFSDSYASLKLALPDIYGDRCKDGSLYRPDVEILNIASKNDMLVENFGVYNQSYKYSDTVYVNSSSPLISHYHNLRDEDTFNLILDLLNNNNIEGEIEGNYIIYGTE